MTEQFPRLMKNPRAANPVVGGIAAGIGVGAKIGLLALVLLAAGCECQQKPIFLPAAMAGKVELVDDCAESCDNDVLASAVAEPEKGGIASGKLLRITDDVEVYRMWNGPDGGLNAYGGSNRLGPWWTAERPSGTDQDYRAKNAICPAWNELKWVAKCTLKKGTLIAIGPTQSARCPSGEFYPANNTQQIYVDNYSPKHVSCGKYLESDYPVDGKDLSVKIPYVEPKPKDCSANAETTPPVSEPPAPAPAKKAKRK